MKDQARHEAPIVLSNERLMDLPATVAVPTYDRAQLTPGIVHIGLGNFHRAHQAWYLHRLMQQGLALDWAVIGAGVRAGDAQQRDRLAAQDYLTTLIELKPSQTTAEVIGPMIGFTPVKPHNAALIAQMADPAIRIVSLTVTEGGYFIDPATKGFDASHADIQHDASHPNTPNTAFGAIIAALKERRDADTGPFTCMSCDNLQGNGAILRQTVVSLARLSDPDLADWIDQNCTFPNSMVDCIVPATGPSELALVRSLGIDDASPVTHENFRQWVIEDSFCAGRPDWDRVGATFTNDVHDFEAMKIRVLNGGHQIIANAGELLSIETIAECIAHEKISAFFQKTAREEILPHLAAVPGMEPTAYVTLINDRFANPRIIDTTRRVAFDGSARHPGFIVPSIKDGLKQGTPIAGLALVEAVWARMCAGIREDGSEIEPNDPFWNDLQVTALQARDSSKIWLLQEQYYGDLAQNDHFAARFDHWLQLIWRDGVESAITQYLGKAAR
ncbi:mannitol dehydrogenase family protein [Roseobacter sp. CCS2]|uniref:mannitol dehydrogenase family protein n=1 Tax=Roseobacter sp. CCS2 TaxID=391593 RepID=UPI0000F40170|nr:mannitol dehydrogenase family protein [Roseobacter sp. CCS2]EBA13414.1 Mannitol dehydrogenase-like protein [Roseobacter sp. CCS2]